MMRQEAKYPDILEGLVNRLKYKDGWTFTLLEIDRGQGSKGLTLDIIVTGADSRKPGQQIAVSHYMIVPPAAYNERSWMRWLLDQILLVERHEACEFFTIDGKHVYGPNHGPGNNPYTIFDQGTEEDSLVDYRGINEVQHA